MASSTSPCQCELPLVESREQHQTTHPFNIYFDNNATTKIDEPSMRSVIEVLQTYDANPSSVHEQGMRCKQLLQRARTTMLQLLDANVALSSLIFTSGCTEANNTVIKGVLQYAIKQRPHAICCTTPIEHDSISRSVEACTKNILYLPVNRQGHVIQQELRRICTAHPDDIALVSIIGAQNEIGTIQHLPELIQIIREECVPDTLVHVDATQLIGKYKLSVVHSLGDPDIVTGSGHKFYGPKGCGFLYVKDIALFGRMVPLLHGGGQELHMRSGTENVAAIVGMVTALQQCYIHMETRKTHIASLKHTCFTELQRVFGAALQVNGDPDHCLYNTLNVTIHYSAIHKLAWLLDKEGIYVSAASACTKTAKSHVLTAIGIPQADLPKTIRISLSKDNTISEIQQFVKHMQWLHTYVLQTA